MFPLKKQCLAFLTLLVFASGFMGCGSGGGSYNSSPVSNTHPVVSSSSSASSSTSSVSTSQIITANPGVMNGGVFEPQKTLVHHYPVTSTQYKLDSKELAADSWYVATASIDSQEKLLIPEEDGDQLTFQLPAEAQNDTTSSINIYQVQLPPGNEEITITPVPGPAADNRAIRGRDCYVLHGILSSTERMEDMAQAIKDKRLYHEVYLVEYRGLQHINLTGQELADKVRQITDAGRGADFVGHSLGGLIIRYAVEEGGLDKVARNVITLGTPHNGTVVANDIMLYLDFLAARNIPVLSWVATFFNRHGFTDSARDMMIGSQFLKNLNQPSRTASTVYDYHTFAGIFDFTTIPSAVLSLTDGVVSLTSANWYGLAKECNQWSHTDLYGLHHTELSHVVKAIQVVVETLASQNGYAPNTANLPAGPSQPGVVNLDDFNPSNIGSSGNGSVPSGSGPGSSGSGGSGNSNNSGGSGSNSGGGGSTPAPKPKPTPVPSGPPKVDSGQWQPGEGGSYPEKYVAEWQRLGGLGHAQGVVRQHNHPDPVVSPVTKRPHDYQLFDRGIIVNLGTDVRGVQGSLWDAYQSYGASTGMMGCPILPQRDFAASGVSGEKGHVLHTEGGYVTFFRGGAGYVNEAFADWWFKKGLEAGEDGFPTSNAEYRTSGVDGSRGRVQLFEGATMFHYVNLYEITTYFNRKYWEWDGLNRLGWPQQMKQYHVESGVSHRKGESQIFQGGCIYELGGNVQVVHGQIHRIHQDSGGPGGPYGFPIERSNADNSEQQFEGGVIRTK